LTAYARHCGATLTRADARGRSRDVVAVGTYVVTDDTSVGTDVTSTDSLEGRATVFADRADQDSGQLKQSISDGKIPTQAGV